MMKEAANVISWVRVCILEVPGLKLDRVTPQFNAQCSVCAAQQNLPSNHDHLLILFDRIQLSQLEQRC